MDDYNYEPELEDFDDDNNMLIDRRPIPTVHERLSQLEQGQPQTASEKRHEENLALFNYISVSVKENPFVQLDKNVSSMSLPQYSFSDEDQQSRHRQLSCDHVKISENKFIKTDKQPQTEIPVAPVKHVLRRARTMIISTKLLDNFFIRNDPRFCKFTKLPLFNHKNNTSPKKNGLLARIASVGTLRSSPSAASLSRIVETQESYATAEFSSTISVDQDNLENSSKSITLMRKMLVEKMVKGVGGAVRTLTRSLKRSHLTASTVANNDPVIDC